MGLEEVVLARAQAASLLSTSFPVSSANCLALLSLTLVYMCGILSSPQVPLIITPFALAGSARWRLFARELC